MSHQDLKDALDHLVREIDTIDPANQTERDELRALADALRRRVERRGAEGAGRSVGELSAEASRSSESAGIAAGEGDSEALQAQFLSHEGAAMNPVADNADGDDNAVVGMVKTYEARYPQVTLILNDIMTRLASMGI